MPPTVACCWCLVVYMYLPACPSMIILYVHLAKSNSLFALHEKKTINRNIAFLDYVPGLGELAGWFRVYNFVRSRSSSLGIKDCLILSASSTAVGVVVQVNVVCCLINNTVVKFTTVFHTLCLFGVCLS